MCATTTNNVDWLRVTTPSLVVHLISTLFHSNIPKSTQCKIFFEKPPKNSWAGLTKVSIILTFFAVEKKSGCVYKVLIVPRGINLCTPLVYFFEFLICLKLPGTLGYFQFLCSARRTRIEKIHSSPAVSNASYKKSK